MHCSADSEYPPIKSEKVPGIWSPSGSGEGTADIMMTPEEKLLQSETEAQALEDSQQFDACIQALVRCVALVRLVYGDGHLKLAQAHAKLAQCYLRLKGWPLQAQEHTTRAGAIIPLCLPGSTDPEKTEVQKCLFTVCYTQGKSALLLGNLEEAEVSLEKADWLFKVLQQVEDAYALVLEVVPGGLDEADICHSLAVACSKSQDPRYLDKAASFFEQSLNAYGRCLGTQDPLTLSVQDEYCRLLLLGGKQEKAVNMMRDSLALKKNVFGDLSTEVADTLQLIGGVEMTQGEMRQAHRTMSKCLEIQSLLYGPQHRRTRELQQTVDLLSRAPEVAGRQQKSRPPFCAVVPSHPVVTEQNFSVPDSARLKKHLTNAKATQ